MALKLVLLFRCPLTFDAYLVELSRLGRQEGGLWCAAGTLGSGRWRRQVVTPVCPLQERRLAGAISLPHGWFFGCRQNGWYDDVNAEVDITEQDSCRRTPQHVRLPGSG